MNHNHIIIHPIHKFESICITVTRISKLNLRGAKNKYDVLKKELSKLVIKSGTKLPAIQLEEFRIINAASNIRYELIQEIQEAIDQGVILNKKFNQCILFRKSRLKLISYP